MKTYDDKSVSAELWENSEEKDTSMILVQFKNEVSKAEADVEYMILLQKGESLVMDKGGNKTKLSRRETKELLNHMTDNNSLHEELVKSLFYKNINIEEKSTLIRNKTKKILEDLNKDFNLNFNQQNLQDILPKSSKTITNNKAEPEQLLSGKKETVKNRSRKRNRI